jgi:hypothetical protein
MWSWPDLRYYPCIFLVNWGKLRKTLTRVIGIGAYIRTGYLLHAGQEALPLQLTWVLTPEKLPSCAWGIFCSYLVDTPQTLPYTETCLEMRWVESVKNKDLLPRATCSYIARGFSNLVASAVQLIRNYRNKKESVGGAAYICASLWHARLYPFLIFMAWKLSSFFLSFLGSTWYAANIWPIVPVPDDRWWVRSSRWNENWQGKPKYSEKTCPSAT